MNRGSASPRTTGYRTRTSVWGAVVWDICRRSHGHEAPEAKPAADGVRAVLAGDVREFALDYPCHSPGEQRWFRMTVSSLDPIRRAGAVVMHVDISESVLAEQRLQRSQAMVELAGRMARFGAWTVEVPSMLVRWSDVVADITTFRPAWRLTSNWQ